VGDSRAGQGCGRIEKEEVIVTIQVFDTAPDANYWERENSHFPLPMSQYLWDLYMPAFVEGTRLGFARYGSLIDHFDVARIRGRSYQRTRLVLPREERIVRYEAADTALSTKLWRIDRAAWPAIRAKFRAAFLGLGRVNLQAMDSREIQSHLVTLRNLFQEGVVQHFLQQPASMFPVGDWLRRTCESTGIEPSEIIALLQGSCPQSGDFLQAIDKVVSVLRDDPEGRAIVQNWALDPGIRLERLRQHSPATAKAIDDYLGEYADRILTGFDIMDATLRELPQVTVALIALRLSGSPKEACHASPRNAAELLVKNRVAPELQSGFQEGLAEARAAYGLHDEDVRITYLWPLGLIRRALLAASDHLVMRGALRNREDIFHTTPAEVDHLLLGGVSPAADEIARRAEEWIQWSREESPTSFGKPESGSNADDIPPACVRMNAAIDFYLGHMEARLKRLPQNSWATFVEGLPASGGSYEGYARIVHGASDFSKLTQGDVLITRTASPLYNMLLPMIGAFVTDRGGALCHAAIVAREFGIPAVVGTTDATLRIPDGARVLVDGDRGFVAVRPE